MAGKNREKKIKQKNPLKTISIIGLVLALIIAWGLVIYTLIWGRGSTGRPTLKESSFMKELGEYDLYNAPAHVLEGDNPLQIERRLTRLQQKVRNMEEQLSVLKRRRILAYLDRSYIPSYRKAAVEASDAFPYSAPLAAVASDSLIAGREIPSEDSINRLKNYARMVSQNRFGQLELCIRIAAGELDNPDSAFAVSGIGNLLSEDLSGFGAQEQKNLLIDKFLYHSAKNDIPAASITLNTLLLENENDAELWRLGAEFYYDHNNPFRAAELFIRLAGQDPLGQIAGTSGVSGERELSRAADALVLAGEIPGARNIWLALSSGGGMQSEESARIESRSLYNMASSSASPIEEAQWLEKFFSRLSQMQRGRTESTEIFSIIRYTRLMESERSIAILEENGMIQHPLLSLELLRRKLDGWPPNRALAEVWLLLGRNPGEEALFEWAAWYFDFQKLGDESAFLLKEAGRRGMTGAWIDLHRGLALLREGKISEGERVFKETAASTDWRILANLGRIEENRRNISSALEYYSRAAAQISMQNQAKNSDAALIQMRLSRCLQALGRFDESRKAMEYASELDPENLNIRRELRF